MGVRDRRGRKPADPTGSGLDSPSAFRVSRVRLRTRAAAGLQSVSAETVSAILGDWLDSVGIAALTPDLIERAERGCEGVRHRVRDDTEADRQVWLGVIRLARAERARFGGPG